MRSRREILNFLPIREHLSLGWKIEFCALLYGPVTLSRVRNRYLDLCL
jgi:hypothetical protein